MQNLNVEMTQERLNYESIISNFSFYKNHADLYLWLNEAEPSEALAVKKLLKKDEVTFLRDRAIENGVEYKGKVYQSAEKDRNLLTSTTSLFSITKQVPDGFKWIAKDNEAVSFTLEDLIALGAKMAESVNFYTMRARVLKDKIDACKSLEELERVELNFNE